MKSSSCCRFFLSIFYFILIITWRMSFHNTSYAYYASTVLSKRFESSYFAQIDTIDIFINSIGMVLAETDNYKLPSGIKSEHMHSVLIPICITRFESQSKQCKRNVTFGNISCSSTNSPVELDIDLLSEAQVYYYDGAEQSSIIYGDHRSYDLRDG